jgi:hypothetical protein
MWFGPWDEFRFFAGYCCLYITHKGNTCECLSQVGFKLMSPSFCLNTEGFARRAEVAAVT